MKFIPNQTLDAIRRQYHKEYDEVFNQIRNHPIGSPERIELNKKELQLHKRTWHFLNKYSFYFSRKRNAIFDELEKKGVYGERPKFEADSEPMKKNYGSRIPQVIKSMKKCVECGQNYIFYERIPSMMCRVCRSVKTERKP